MATKKTESTPALTVRQRAEALGLADQLVWTEDGQRLAPHIANATTLLAQDPAWAGKLYVEREQLPEDVEHARWNWAKGLQVEQWLRIAADAPIFPSEAPARPDDPAMPWDGALTEDVARVACWLARTWGLLLPLAEVALAAVLVAKAQARGETRGEQRWRLYPLEQRRARAIAAQRELAARERQQFSAALTFANANRHNSLTQEEADRPARHQRAMEAAAREAERLEGLALEEWGPGGCMDPEAPPDDAAAEDGGAE